VHAFIRAARDEAAGVAQPIGIAPAMPADAGEIGAVHVQAWREAYPGLVPDSVLARLDVADRAALWTRVIGGDGITLVARDANGDIVGFISAGTQRSPALPFAAEIGALYVLRRAHRQGVGRRLMAAAARALLGRGMDGASLWVLDGNAPAIAFYSALGGHRVGRRNLQGREWDGTETAFGWNDLRQLAG